MNPVSEEIECVLRSAERNNAQSDGDIIDASVCVRCFRVKGSVSKTATGAKETAAETCFPASTVLINPLIDNCTDLPLPAP